MKGIGRLVLATILLVAGIGHFRSTESFAAQVPPWMPAPTAVIYVSGVIEIVLGLSLLFIAKQRVMIGWVIAGFFIVIFPGNISQYVTGADAFGLDSDMARLIRLFFQPLLVLLAVWSTGAWPSSIEKGAGRTKEKHRG